MPYDKCTTNAVVQTDIVTLEDGYKYYWVAHKGALSASNLRTIADVLDEQNKEWDRQVQEYFDAHKGE